MIGGLVSDLDVLFGAGDSKKIDRPEHETRAGAAVQRELDLLATVAPGSAVVSALEASEVGVQELRNTCAWLPSSAASRMANVCSRVWVGLSLSTGT